MAELRSPLESPEAFAAYKDRIRHQLKAQVVERIAFLESATEELGALETLARRASNVPLVAELANLAQMARHECAALNRFDSVADPSPIATDVRTVEPLHGVIRESRVTHHGPDYFTETAPHAPYSTDFRSTAYRPAAPRPAPVIPTFPKTPARQVDEIFRDVETLAEEVESGLAESGIPGVVRLKAQLCRQRALQSELAAQDIQHWPLQQLISQIRRRVDEEHGPDHYLIPLRRELWPTEAWPWQQLAELYIWLAKAYETLSWFDHEADSLGRNDRHELLESIAAHQTRLYRHLQAYFPRQNDEHQITLFRDLCAIADDEDVYLQCLQERFPDDLLAERAEAMPAILERLHADRASREKRDRAVALLRALVGRSGFGAEPEDHQALVRAVVACRSEGEPCSSLVFRETISKWIDTLESSEDRCVQEVARELKMDADRSVVRVDDESPVGETKLTESERAELDSVRAVVAGKKCLFIGGVCREESRQKLEKELGLAELVWPSTNGAESVYKFEPDIQNTDFTVVLVRFMRTGWGQARELAVRNGKPFVRLPAGYGLKQVVRQFHQQLPAREVAVESK